MAKSRDVLLGFLAGAAVGAAFGILYAPDKGEVTRRRLQQKADELKDTTAETVKEKLATVKESANSMVSRFKSSLAKAEKELEELSDACTEKLEEDMEKGAEKIEKIKGK